jgi:amino acid transporter
MMLARLLFAAAACYWAGMAIAWPLSVVSGVQYRQLWPSVVVGAIVTAWAIIAIKYRG